MKRTVILIAAMLLIACVAFAGSDREGGPDSDSDWPFMNTPASELEGELNIWHWHSTFDLTYTECMAASGFTEDFPNVTVNLVQTATGLDEFLVALAANTGLPSVVFIDSSNYGALVQKNAVQDLTDRMLPHKNEFFPIAWSILDVDDRIYGVPDVFNALSMIYRRDIFEAAGFPSAPKDVSELLSTWDKYIEVGEEINEKTGALLVALGPTVSWNYDGIQSQVVTGVIDKDGEVLLDSPEMIEVTRVLKEIWDLGLAKEYDPFTAQWFQDHNDGVFATRINFPWMTEFLTRNIPDTIGKWGLIELPAFFEGGERGAVQSISASVIPANIPDEEKELAWRFLEYIYTTTEGNLPFMTGETGWMGNFYSYIPAIETLRDIEFPLLDGQKQYDYYYGIMTSEDIVPAYQPAGTAKGLELWHDAIYRIMEEGADVEEALADAADLLRAELASQ